MVNQLIFIDLKYFLLIYCNHSGVLDGAAELMTRNSNVLFCFNNNNQNATDLDHARPACVR
jgi:hypothetical protein